jgi:hypothetical protein
MHVDSFFFLFASSLQLPGPAKGFCASQWCGEFSFLIIMGSFSFILRSLIGMIPFLLRIIIMGDSFPFFGRGLPVKDLRILESDQQNFLYSSPARLSTKKKKENK